MVGDQPVDTGVRKTVSSQREEQSLLGDRLIENLVAQVVHECFHFAIGPTTLVERRKNVVVPVADFLEEDSVLVGQSMPLARAPVGITSGRRTRGRGGSLLFTRSEGHHGTTLARKN